MLIGNEEDFVAALGLDVAGTDGSFGQLESEAYAAMLAVAATRFPNLKAIAVTLRVARTANRNDWGACSGRMGSSTQRPPGATSISSIASAVATHSHRASSTAGSPAIRRRSPSNTEPRTAPAMTTPGDTSMATQAEVEALMAGAGARVRR